MSELTHAVWEGEITVMGVKLKCFVLDDGRRIIAAESFHEFLRALDSGGEFSPVIEAEFMEAAKFMQGKGVPA